MRLFPRVGRLLGQVPPQFSADVLAPFDGEIGDVYPDPLRLSLTSTGMRGGLPIVQGKERREAGGRKSRREATLKRNRSAEEPEGAQGSREARQEPARPAKGLRVGQAGSPAVSP